MPATAAEQSSAVEPGDKDDDDDGNDVDDELVPQVMVGPDGNLILNPGTWVAITVYSVTVCCYFVLYVVLAIHCGPKLCFLSASLVCVHQVCLVQLILKCCTFLVILSQTS